MRHREVLTKRKIFLGRVGKGEAPAISMSGYGAVTSGVGKNRRYDADAEEELDRIAQELDQVMQTLLKQVVKEQGVVLVVI